MLLFCNKDTRNVWKKWFIWVYNMFLCRCEQTDGKKYSTNLSKKTGRSRSLENKDSRVRSFTIETNASMDSLSNKIALGTSTALFDLDNTKAEVYVPLTTPYEGEIRHTQSWYDFFSLQRTFDTREEIPVWSSQLRKTFKTDERRLKEERQKPNREKRIL